jgi:membrane-associated protease RseP (regulator of RpoE activity)
MTPPPAPPEGNGSAAPAPPGLPIHADPFRHPISRPGVPAPPRPGRPRGWGLSLVLLLLTFATTLLTGIGFEAGARGLSIGSLTEILERPSILLLGLPYSLSLLAILGTHEMGHYLACVRYGIDATPPYFIPSPLLFGTFGAFIRIRAPITDRRALFDIGIAGPLAGFAVALPVIAWGILTAEWRPEIPGEGGLYLGDCLATRILVAFVAEPPPAPDGYVFTFGGMAMAGWVGLLATALNLLPVGQLDGGHIAYAVSQRFHRWASRLSLGIFVALGLVINESWLFWATLLVLFSPRHPRLIDESGRLATARLALAALAVLILAACFIPDPLRPAP